MASFADQISQFNPYIQQLPVDAMTQVGMYKQQKYDEGVQKIQSYIDNVAGMDVIRDIDKGYLQSKLNELGSKLKTVAAGDFSNYQLVNSVGGMATQIVKDRYVQNAVLSTKKYRKGVEEMDLARKEGKSAPSNEWLFKFSAKEWMDSNDLDRTFNESYSPYTNYRKNAIEVLKALTKDSTIRDDAFTLDKNGRMVIADAVLRRKLEGNSPEKIQQALLVGLTPSDWKQMEIDGRYNYSNVDAQSFASSVKSSYEGNIQSFLDQRTVLENSLSSTKSAQVKEETMQKISEIDKMIGRIRREGEGVMESINEGNIESAKAKLFTSNFLSGFSRAFSYTETSETYETSPLATMQMERDKFAWNKQTFAAEFNLKQRIHSENKQIELAKLEAAREANRLKATELLGYGGFPSPVDPKDVPDIAIGKVVGAIEGLNQRVVKADDDLIRSQGKDAAWLEQQRQAWVKAPNSVDPIVSKHFYETSALKRLASENQIMLNRVSSEADRRYGDVYSKIPQGAPDIVYTKPDGTVYRYSARDFVDFNAKIKDYMIFPSASGAGGRPASPRFDDDRAKRELSPKEYKLYEIGKQRYLGGDKSLTRADGIVSQNMLNYNKLINIPYEKVLDEKLKWVGNELKRRVTGFQGVDYTIPTDTKAQEESLANVFTSVANLAQSQKGAIANSPNLNVGILRKNAEGANVKGTVKVVEGTEFSPRMYEVTSVGAGGTTSFRITPEQKDAIFGRRFEATPEVAAVRPYISAMRKFSTENSPYYSTSLDGKPTTPENSYLNPADFPSVKNYGVSANLVSPDELNTFSVRFNIYDPVTKKMYKDIPYPRMLTQSEIAGVLVGMNDAAIYEMINGGKMATRNDMQLLEKASEKPF